MSPQQKVRIVADLQRAGHVVAMTGDGTNDAAAIRLADVGIGVSARGSTAARNASDLILTASNLSDMAGALAEGRALWRNVADALSILLGGNVGEIAFMIVGTALGATLAWAGSRLTGRRQRAATMGLAAVISTKLAQTLLSNARSPVVILTSAASGGVLMFVVNTPGISQFFGCTPLGQVAWTIVGASTTAAICASAAASRFSAIGKAGDSQ